MLKISKMPPRLKDFVFLTEAYKVISKVFFVLVVVYNFC